MQEVLPIEGYPSPLHVSEMELSKCLTKNPHDLTFVVFLVIVFLIIAEGT